jgi:hypothetical protein
MNKFGLMLVAVTLSAQPFANAWAQGGSASSTAAAKGDDSGKQICKADNPTGTRVSSKKICKTKAEWDEFNRQQRADAQRIQNNALDQKIQTGGN